MSVDQPPGESDDPFKRVAAAATRPHSAARPSTEEGWTHVSPVPASAPEATFKHTRHGSPSHAPWAYRAADGQLLAYVVRFASGDGGKEVLPRTLWRDANGQLRWKWRGAHGVRALYGLDRLAARPDAPVLLVEGEKTADAAERRFANFVTVTWPGGGGAVSRADWSPLRGRRVVAWPDADSAGSLAADAAIAGALSAGATSGAAVKLPRGLPDKWDLADEWPEGFGQEEAEALIEETLSQATPGVVWPYGYRMESSGLWYDKPTDGKLIPIRLADSFQVIGEARDPEGGDWSVVVQFKDPDGRAKTQVIPKGTLASAPGEVRSRLASEGLFINVQRGQADRFTAAMAEVKATNRLTLVNATGWASDERFVLPHRTVGPAGCEPVLFTGNPSALHYGAEGSLDGWKREVAALASGNPLLLFSLAISFAGPLLRPLSVEGGGFHLRGPSSCGKTTLALAAGSTWGGGGPLGAAHSWRATANALEMVAYGHSETMLVLDELALVAAEEAGQAAYSLASGQAKGRARQDGSLRPRAEWRVMLLSTGEIGLADHIRTSRRGDRAMAGQELRLLDIPADGRAGLGVWEHLHGFATPAELSDTLKRASGQHYGHAGPEFVHRLVQDRAGAIEMVKNLMRSFLKEAQRHGDTGQVHRGAHRFALAAAAGELAAGFGVTPWAELEAFNAALTLFDRWASAFGRNSVREEQSVLQVLRAAIEMHQARFAPLRPDDGPEWESHESSRAGEARALNTLGYIHRIGGETYYLVHQSGWLEIFRGNDPVFAAKALDEAGFLHRGDHGRLQRAQRVQGQVRRFYFVKSALLGDDAPA